MEKTPLQLAIDQAQAEDNIDLMVPAIFKSRFFIVSLMVDEEGASGPWIVPSHQDSRQPMLTVSENEAWLTEYFKNLPGKERIYFDPISGADLFNLATGGEFEVFILFEDTAYKLPRSYFEYWASLGEDDAD